MIYLGVVISTMTMVTSMIITLILKSTDGNICSEFVCIMMTVMIVMIMRMTSNFSLKEAKFDLLIPQLALM